MNTANSNATTSDNSSDSASHNKKSTKSEIEIIDQKIIKCINEVNYYKQKIQREWSKQMNSHLKNFYPDDILNDSANKSGHNNDNSINNTNSSLTNSFSTPQQSSDSGEYDKKINLLNKKLRSYEKRRHKLVYESKQEQDAATAAAAVAAAAAASGNNVTSNISNNPTAVNALADTKIEKLFDTSAATNASTNATATNTTNATISTNVKLNIINNQRNGSFVLNANQMTGSPAAVAGVVKMATSNGDLDMFGPLKAGPNGEEKTGASTFYISHDTAASMVKFPPIVASSSNEPTDLIGDEQNSSQLMANKSFQTLDRNMFYIQVEQQLYYLKLQQEKMQSDVEEMHKKIQDNHQLMIKELQNTCNQISEHVHKISFNFYKSCDSKLEDLKTSFDRSMQSLGYNLTHAHRDIKEAKEDVTYMKNKIEIIEKSQKVHSIETNPTNYYQLFYKLLDIMLTLATIILLAFTNMIASIKFVFLLYPRIIVMFFLIYFFFFYLIDQEKLDIYFHKILLNDSKYSSSELATLNEEYASKANLSLLGKLINMVYRIFFQYKSKGEETATAT